ncbi:MAG: hypothetical protein ABL886_10140 [Rhodoglobus sp.]
MVRARLGTLAIALVAAAASFIVVGSIQPTEAAWTAGKVLSTTVSSVTPAAVPTVTCGAASGGILSTIPISWTAPPGPTPSRYRLHWAGSAGTGDAFFTTSPGSINASGISVAGTSVITVFPEYGNWTTSPASLQTRSFTTIAIIVVVSWTCT